MQVALSCKNLNTVISTTTILKDVSCSFPKSSVTIIIGRSGAGKSTLLRSLVRFYGSTGQIIFNGENIDELSINELRRSIVYVGQIPVTFPGTVKENLAYGRQHWGLEVNDEILTSYLDLVGLEIDLTRNSDKLSVGQKQRLHLARSSAIGPEILLLDEPASALDVISKNKFEQMITKLREANSNLTIIMVTHDLDQARRMGDHLILLEEGDILLSESNKQFFENTLVNKEIGINDGALLENLIQRIRGENA